MTTTAPPKHLRACPDCGELRNAARRILCRCDGYVCGVCNEGWIRRPISDHWDSETGRTWHTPAVMGLKPCDVCGASAVRAWWRPIEVAA